MFQLLEDALALGVGQRCRRPEVKTELNPRIGGVDSLPTRPGGVRELFNQFVGRHDQARRDAWSSRYV